MRYTIYALCAGAKCSIAGRVIDQQQSPVAYAAVAIYQGKVPVAGVVTDSHGRFALKTDLSTTEYRLAVEFIGYEKYKGLIITNKPHIDLGTILLKEAAVEVAEVVVTGKEVAQKSTVEHKTAQQQNIWDDLRVDKDLQLNNNQL